MIISYWHGTGWVLDTNKCECGKLAISWLVPETGNDYNENGLVIHPKCENCLARFKQKDKYELMIIDNNGPNFVPALELKSEAELQVWIDLITDFASPDDYKMDELIVRTDHQDG